MKRIFQLCSLVMCIGVLAAVADEPMSARIDSIQKTSNGVYITFTVSGAPDFINVEGSSTLTGIYREEQNVEILPAGAEILNALVPVSTDDRFFRIRLMSRALTNTLILPIQARQSFGNDGLPNHLTPIQQIYAAPEFSDAPADVIDIHGVRLRLDAPMAILNVSVKRLTIRMGLYRGMMSELPPQGFIIPDSSIAVFDRENVQLTRVSGEPPAKAFDVEVPFNGPYRYNRGLGHLVMQVEQISTDAGGFTLDAVYPVQGEGLIYVSDSPSAHRAVNAMLVSKFLYTVP
jgi:hypothetical protein